MIAITIFLLEAIFESLPLILILKLILAFKNGSPKEGKAHCHHANNKLARNKRKKTNGKHHRPKLNGAVVYDGHHKAKGAHHAPDKHVWRAVLGKKVAAKANGAKHPADVKGRVAVGRNESNGKTHHAHKNGKRVINEIAGGTKPNKNGHVLNSI